MSIDRNSPTWQAVKARLGAAIESDLLYLETPIGEAETARVRGRLFAYRAVLSMADDKPEIKDTDQLY